MGHVFISYSRVDQAYCRALADDLRRRGFEVWIDDRIDYGDRWWQTIVGAIRACSAFVVVMSPDAERSEWVERELMLAQRESKPIFPLLLRGREFPLLITTQFADVTRGQLPPPDFYDRLYAVVPPRAEARSAVPPPRITPPPTRAQPRPLRRLKRYAQTVVLAVLLGILLAGAIVAGRLITGNKREATPALDAEFPSYAALVATPIGGGSGQLVFSGSGGTYLVNSDGSGEYLLTSAGGLRPRWSPDGQWIAFASMVGGNYEVFVSDAEGGRRRQLTDHDVVDGVFAWSPDSRRIAFPSWNEQKKGLYTLNIDGSDERQWVTGFAYAPTWSPDGTQIAFVNIDSPGISVVDTNTGSQWQLPSRLAEHDSPHWSPDGTQIAFVGPEDQLYVMDVNRYQQRQVAAHSVVSGAGPWQIAWSPDSTRIAFVSGSSDPRIYIVGADGSGERRLTGSTAIEYEPRWSPDGRWIAYEADGGVRATHADTGETRTLAAQGVYPDWRP